MGTLVKNNLSKIPVSAAGGGLNPAALANYAKNSPLGRAVAASMPQTTTPTASTALPPPPPPPAGANTPSPLPNTGAANTGVSTVSGQSNLQQIPPYLLQELLMGARYNNPYMSGISGPYQMPQYAGLQNIAPWAMPQNPSMYGGGFGMPYSNNMQSPLPMNGAQMPYQSPDYYAVSGNYQNNPNIPATNLNSLLSSLANLGAWR